MGAEDVTAAVQAAHTAQHGWAALPCKVSEELVGKEVQFLPIY